MLIVSLLILIASTAGLAVQLRRTKLAMATGDENPAFLHHVYLVSWTFILLSALASLVLLLTAHR